MPAAAAALLALAILAAAPAEASAAASPPPAAAAPSRTPSPSPTPSPQRAAKPSCPDFEFIGARGSGEDNTVAASKRYTAADPTLGMGGPVHDLYARVSATAAKRGLTMTPFAVPYPAVGIDAVGASAVFGGELDTYQKSVELGSHAAAAELERVAKACPNTGVIVAGYSQGAQVIVDAVRSASAGAREALSAAVFFGSTFFTADDTSDDYSDYSPGLDGYLVHSDASDGPFAGTQWPRAFGQAPIFDYCHDGDPICGLVDEREVGGTRYPVRDFAHIITASADDSGDPSIFSKHTTYQRGDTANAAQQLRLVLGLPLDRVTTAPTVRVTTRPATTVATTTLLNGGGTLSDPGDPVISYRWSIDPGSASARTLTTPTPILGTEFGSPGIHTVVLRVTTREGRTAQASVSIDALAAPTAPPATPKKAAATPGDGSATLSWAAVGGADFYAVTDAQGKLLTAFTPLTAGQATVSWTDTDLANGRSRSYLVYAVNDVGRSTAPARIEVTPKAAPTSDSAPTIQMPQQRPTAVDPELAWSLGLGVIALVVLSLLLSGRRRVRR